MFEGGYTDSEGFFLDELGNRLEIEPEAGPDIDQQERAITIPVFHYKSLAYLLDDILPGSKGVVIWTSTDGCFEAGVYTDGMEKTYKLEDWVKSQEFSAEELDPQPNMETSPEDWFQWAGEVEQLFFEEFS